MQERLRSRLPPDPLEEFIEVQGKRVMYAISRQDVIMKNQAWKVFRGCYLQHQASCRDPRDRYPWPSHDILPSAQLESSDRLSDDQLAWIVNATLEHIQKKRAKRRLDIV
jgi:hypothetical protein